MQSVSLGGWFMPARTLTNTRKYLRDNKLNSIECQEHTNTHSAATPCYQPFTFFSVFMQRGCLVYRHSQANINMAKLNTQSGVSKATGGKSWEEFPAPRVRSSDESCHPASCWLENWARKRFSSCSLLTHEGFAAMSSSSFLSLFFLPSEESFRTEKLLLHSAVPLQMFFFRNMSWITRRNFATFFSFKICFELWKKWADEGAVDRGNEGKEADEGEESLSWWKIVLKFKYLWSRILCLF